MYFHLVPLMGILALGISGCGSSTEDPSHSPLSTQTAPLQQGQNSTLDKYTFALVVGDDPTKLQFRCSGTLIAPNLFLTARHCFSEYVYGANKIDCRTALFGKDLNEASKYWVSNDQDSIRSTIGRATLFQGAQLLLPTWKGACESDIAVLRLVKNVPETVATPASVVLRPRLDLEPEFGRRIVAVGYGETGPALEDFGFRRIKQNVLVKCIQTGGLVCKDKESRLAMREIMTEGGACDGDSGSGAFENDAYKRGEVLQIGVFTRTSPVNGLCLDNTYVRTDAWAPFLVNAATIGSKEGGYALPAWAKAGYPLDRPLPGSVTGALPRRVGSECNFAADCESAKCATNDLGLSYYCATPCEPKGTNSCPKDFRCVEQSAGTGLCFSAALDPKSGGDDPSGCEIGTRAHLRGPEPLGRAVGGSVFVVFALAMIRRRSARACPTD